MSNNQNSNVEEDEFKFGEEEQESALTPVSEGEAGDKTPAPSESPAPSDQAGGSNVTRVVSDSLIKDSPEFEAATADIIPETAEERRLSKKQLLTKRFFDKQPRVPIFIPLEKGEVKGTLAYFATNGYKFYVQKGMVVQVPEGIAKRYYETLGAESSALNDHELNLANASEDKLKRLTR